MTARGLLLPVNVTGLLSMELTSPLSAKTGCALLVIGFYSAPAAACEGQDSEGMLGQDCHTMMFPTSVCVQRVQP